MKKTYMSPCIHAVEISVRSIVATSIQIFKSDYTEEQIDNSEEILTKEERNIWDEKW